MPETGPHTPATARRRADFSVQKMPGFAAIAIACFVILYAPIITLVIYSFNESRLVTVWGVGYRWEPTS